MEIINNRYKVIKKVSTPISHVQEFLVNDLWSENKMLNLKIVSSMELTKDNLDFFKDYFITISNIDNHFHLKNYGFSGLYLSYPSLPSPPPDQVLYIFTTEHVENGIPVLEFIKTASMEDILKIIIAVCQSLIHAINMGFEYDVFTHNNVIIVKEKENFKIRIKDIVSSKLENSKSVRFREVEDYTGIDENIEPLILFIVSLLLKKEIKANLSTAVSALKTFSKNEILSGSDCDIFNTLYRIVKKHSHQKNKENKTKIFSIIQDINKGLNRNYPADVIPPLNSITFRPKLVGLQEELNILLRARNETNIKKNQKSVFLVKGYQGVGKTRLLKEAEYRLGLEGTNIYSYYNLKTSTIENFWNDFLEKIFLNSYLIQDINAKENIIKNVQYIREERDIMNTSKEYENTKFKILTEAKNMFFKTVGHTPCLLIIDDVELADDFMLDTFIYLATEVTQLERLGIVLSYDESAVPVSSKFPSFVNILNHYQKTQSFELNDFSEEETIEMVKNILLLNYRPLNLGPIIYKHTSGCPSFIIEMIKEFVNTGIISRDINTGMWIVPDNIYSEEIQKKIPTSIEETLKNQFNTLSSTEKKIFLETSLFQNIFKIDYIYKLLKMPEKKIDKTVGNLVNKGLLSVLKTRNKIEYTITNKIMRNIVYQLMDSKYRMSQHKKISTMLQKEPNIDMNELIWHLEESGNKKAALNCCLDIVEKNMQAKNIGAVIKIYEKIPRIIFEQKAKDKFRILLNIFSLYNQMGLRSKELEIKQELETILPKIKDAELLSNFYYLMTKYEYKTLNAEATLTYIKKLNGLYTKFGTDIINLRLQHCACLYYHITQKNKALKEATYRILRITKNKPEYLIYRTEAYILLGYLYHQKLNKKKALKCFQNAKHLAYLCNNIKTELIAMYNISVIYYHVHSDIEKTILYTKNVINIAKKLGFLSIEIISIINYARMLAEIQNNYEAYKYAKEAESKILTYDMAILKLPCIITLMQITQNLSRYKEFFEYRKKYIKTAKTTKTKAVYQHNFTFYTLLAKTYQEFGYNNKAITYLKKSIKIKKYQPECNIFMIYIMLDALKIIQKKKNDITTLIRIFNAYMKEKLYPSSNNRKFTREFFDTIITIIIKRTDIDFTALISQIVKYDNYDLHDFQRSGMYYLKNYLTKTDTEQLLHKNLEVITPKKLPHIALFINLALGDHYRAIGEQRLAVTHFLEAQNKIKYLIMNTPVNYKVKIFNNWSFNKPFDIVSAFIDGKNITKEKLNNRNINQSELISILKLNQINTIKKDTEFRNLLIQDLLRHEGYENTTSVEIINSFTDNYLKNIYTVMEFLAVNVLASKYDFLELKASDDLQFTLNYEDEKGHLKQLLKLITKIGYKNIDKIEKEFPQPCMIIPVNKKGNRDYKPLGFMIFISENVINNFSHQGRMFCKKHANLLVMLIESENFKQVSAFDILTGAYTRKHFEFFLKNLIKNSSNVDSQFSIILYDLDKFKNINDSYGHLVGDIVLKKVTQTILTSLTQGQIIGRYGGEEFIIVLSETDTNKALKIAEYFRKKIENLTFDEFETNITISLGIASFPKHGITASELITKADQALYHSKNNGRNKSTVWTSSLTTKQNDKINQAGVVIADESSFNENISATIEICDILKNTSNNDQPLPILISKIVKFFEAESGAVILKSSKKESNKSAFKVIAKIGFETYPINENLVNITASDGIGICRIDWDEIARRNTITNMPEWNSVMLTPLIKNQNIIGVLYLAAPEKNAKFNLSKFNFFKFIADIISANI